MQALQARQEGNGRRKVFLHINRQLEHTRLPHGMSTRLAKTLVVRIKRQNREGSFVVRVCYQPPYQVRKWTKSPFKQVSEVSVSSSPGLQEMLNSLTSAARATHWTMSSTGGGGGNAGVCGEWLLFTEAE